MPEPSAPLSLRLARLAWRVRLGWRRVRGTNRSVDMATLIPFYRRLWAEAATALSATVTELSEGVWRVRRGDQSTLIHNYVVQLDDPVTLHVAGDKALCHRLLREAGLPVPEHAVFSLRTIEVAERFMSARPGQRFVVKPAAHTSGARGVTTHIGTRTELRKASALASLYCDDILIERWVAGESYRLLFLDGEMIHASRRRGGRVTGDGRLSLRELISRDTAHDTSAATGRDRAATLQAQGLMLDWIPEAGRTVLVQSAADGLSAHSEIRTVFDEDASRDIGAELQEEAARVVRAVGSRFAGVDLITCDPTRSLGASQGVVNEINTTPGLHHHSNLKGGVGGAAPAMRVLACLLGVGAGVAPALASMSAER